MTTQTPFLAYVLERRRLEVLWALRRAPAYTATEVLLGPELRGRGVAASREQIRDDLRHLADRRCLVLQTPGGVWIATLTAQGADAADGLGDPVDGVARPLPGEVTP